MDVIAWRMLFSLSSAAYSKIRCSTQTFLWMVFIRKLFIIWEFFLGLVHSILMRHLYSAILLLRDLQVHVVHLFLYEVYCNQVFVSRADEHQISRLEGDRLNGSIKYLFLHYDLEVMEF